MARIALISFVIGTITTASNPPQNTFIPQLGNYGQHLYSEPEYVVQGPPRYDPQSVPACAANTTKTWCLEDSEYPEYEIKGALQYHNYPVLALYADVADLNTELSVERPNTLDDENYICSSETTYIRPLRAVNDEGKWRIIVNEVKVNYESYLQTVRIEECNTAGKVCPLVPKCYISKCLQKSIYHRFLIYDPYDYYFPFVVENFKLPSACLCLLGAYTINH